MMRFIAVLSLFVLAGCENALYNLVSENTKDPSISAPQAGMFSSLSGIPVSWSKDDNASGYVLYRRVLTSNTASVVYTGTGQSFFDDTAAPDTMYAYTLAKYRGQETFAQGSQVVGAWDVVYVRDPNGSNDTQATATLMGTNTVNDRIFYYSTADVATGLQALLSDTDWYYVELPSHTQYQFAVTYGDGNQTQDLIVSTTSDTLIYGNNEDTLFLRNPADTLQRVWFNVHFNPAKASLSTQVRVDYTLSFLQISTYNPVNP